MERFEISIRTTQQLQALLPCAGHIKRCYVGAKMLLAAVTGASQENAESVVTFLQELKTKGVDIYAALPYMTREEENTPDVDDLKRLLELTSAYRKVGDAGKASVSNHDSKNSQSLFGIISGALVRNLEQLSFLAEQDFQGKIILDAQIYMWNAQSIRELAEDELLAGLLEGYTLPLEESVHAWRDTLAADKSGLVPTVILYGRAPMMVSAGCVLKTTTGCSGHKGQFYSECLEMEDRTGRKLPVECSCRYCYNVIWNAHPLSLHKVYFGGMHLKNVSCRLDFTTETPKEVFQIVEYFGNEAADTGKPPYTAYTTGRFQKGVE